MTRFKTGIAVAAATAMTLTLMAGARAQRQMENLGRGVVAINQGGGKVFVGWRMLGADPENIAFNLYRTTGAGKPVKLNAKPLAGPTNFVDTGAKLDQSTSYFVRPVLNGREQAASAPFTLPANAPARPYLSIPLKTPPPVKTAEGEFPYTPNDASVGDLDGDGEYEIVLHQTGRGRDNSQSGETNPPILQAYKLDGTLLWTINLGRNIREGAHYTQFMVYDLDGDGKAETVCKTADGTTDSQGKVIGDANANYVDGAGRILAGPEYLTVFDSTGKAVATTDYIPSRFPDDPKNLNPTTDQMRSVWRDGSGNQGDRFLACVAYLDGVRPSVVMARGYYGRTFLAAWDFRGGKLSHRWTFDSKDWDGYGGQGNHSLSVADVDGDGKDEIVYGGMTVDDDGKGLFTTGYGHGDALHVGDLDPQNPGLEMFRIQESFGDAGAHMVALRTGKTLWKKPSLDRDAPGGKRQGPGRGLAADIDPRTPGAESWVLGAGIKGLWDARGNQIADHAPTLSLPPGQITYGFDTPVTRPRQVPTANFRVYWDGDTLDELLDGNQVVKWDWEKRTTRRLLLAEGCTSVNGTKANPSLSADILGDWREEVIFPTNDGKELRIFTTTIPTQRRLYTLMHDPVYRLSIAWQNVAYNQPPHLGFSIGPGMKPAPRPNITLVAANRSQPSAPASVGKTAWKFDFGSGRVAPGTIQVLPTTTYSPGRGYGFEPGAAVTASDRKPFLFSVALPEGNYNVTVTLGDRTAASDTTVKAEQRRLMLENVRTTPGRFTTRTFTVNVRTPRIAGGGEVGLKPGEKGPPLAANWDEKLTLEFNGTRPCVAALEIARVDNALTVFLAGDSTVTDGRHEPWSAWGQMLPRFFTPGVAVANYAESGLTLGSFRAQRRLEKILSVLKPGDYVLIQFGHNDQKDRFEGAGPFTSYKSNLKEFVTQIRSKGGLPVIVTPMERRRWSPEGKPQQTLSEFAEAARQAGKEENVPVIDLHAMSLKLYEALGPEGSKKAFVHHPANTFPGQREALKDDTHFGNYGAYELARSVVGGIKADVPALAKRLADDVTPYDPSRPDPVERFRVPASPFAASEKPDGS